MTSSYKATGAASVRQPRAAVVETPSAWTLNELAVPAKNFSFDDDDVDGSPIVVEMDPAILEAERAAERAALIDEHYARGLVDGERKASAAAAAQVEQIRAFVATATDKLADAANIAPGVLEENIATLAVIVARHIVQREVAMDSDVVADLVRRSLTEFPIDQTVRIRVNPMDLALLTMNGDKAPITGKHDVSWLADNRISRGGCLIEGRDRIVDGRVDTALERAYRKMAKHDA
ncbi:MAG TPA: FliH/SctL family protein [Gemmatimonadaceae bacterium]|jgi:flagellar biosynthesis/type III secretory pathway protein FliH